MYYLADFEYKPLSKQYKDRLEKDSTLRKRIKTKNNLKLPLDYIPESYLNQRRLEMKYSKINKKIADNRKELSKKANDNIFNNPFNNYELNDLVRKRVGDIYRRENITREPLSEINEILTKYNVKDLNNELKKIKVVTTDNPSHQVPKVEKKIKDKISEKVTEVINKPPTQKTKMNLGNKALLGTVGLAGLGAMAYGINKLRKSRSDKNKKRGSYKK